LAVIMQSLLRVFGSAIAALGVTPSTPVTFVRAAAVAGRALVATGPVSTWPVMPLAALATHRRPRSLPRRATLLPLTISRRDFLG
jgi:hypothetical protein